MKKINSKNGSAAKKLIPAAGMLGISAVMLGTSTFAWFTMSKEVNVTGIKMTASVPSNIQISLGNNMFNSTGEDWAALDVTVDSGKLTGVKVPGADDKDLDWTNTVAISDYYAFGKLTPATSITGANLYFTKSATGVGKTIKMTDATTIDNSQFAAANADTNAASKLATVAMHTGKGTGGIAPTTYDLGGAYYIDIPVWFRTSSSSAVNLAVKATITPGTSTKGSRSEASENSDLFKAARVSIIQGEGTVPSAYPEGVTTDNAKAAENITSGATVTQGVIYNSASESVSGKTLQSKYYSEVDAYKTGRLPASASGAYTYDGTETAGWKAVTKITEAVISGGLITNGSGDSGVADTVAVVPAPTGNKNYGVPARYTIRIWIDGEDVNCWNATAAQDFNIELNFIDKAYASDTP